MKLAWLPRSVTHAGLTLVATAAILHGCSSDTLTSLPAWTCERDGGRPPVGESVCTEASPRFVQNECVADRCDTPGSSCCPGTVCTGGGECIVPPARVMLCEDDGDCEAGMRCLERPLIDPESKSCGFPQANDTSDCAEGRVFNGRCLAPGIFPCGHSCPAGQVCNIDTSSCETPPTLLNDESGCDQQCGEGELLVYSDPDSMLWDRCCAVRCECLTLPPLTPGRWGRYSDMVLRGGELLVSAYDSTYGDLVLGVFRRDTGAITGIDSIDGFPAVGAVVADPDGPRGGRDAPGADVGTHTAIALYNGEPRIAYYDVDSGNLKYAAYDSADGSWLISLVDDGRDEKGEDTGDVGRYASLVIDDSGLAQIAYYAHRTLLGGRLVTGPRYARALSASPGRYDDWERIPVETVGSCNDTCLAGQVCAASAGGPTCFAPRDDCDGCACDEICVDSGGAPACLRAAPLSLAEPCDGTCPAGFSCVAEPPSGSICRQTLPGGCGGCGSGEVCVDDGGAVCRTETPYSSFQGLPEGVGLFTSTAIYGNTPVMVYYDGLLGQLRVAVATFGRDEPLADFATWPLACETGVDMGQQASLAVEPGDAGVLVAYQADGDETLWVYRGDLLGGASELVDDGSRQGGTSKVGESPSIAIDDGTGNIYIAYGDQTLNDVVLAYERDGVWRRLTVLQDGAYGSFTNLAVEGSRGWITTYLRERDERGQDTSRLELFELSLDGLP